ncbi:DUF6653 family protein [Bounagaea algeriensis]
MEFPGTVARVRRAVFARHANPCSAWTRWASAPLVLVPVWTRSWRHAAVVAAWFAINPVLFAKPQDERAWSTRAMLGEEMWVLARPKDAGMVVNVVAATACALAMVSARRRRLKPAVVLTAAQMTLILVYWELMARYFDEHQRDASSTAATG